MKANCLLTLSLALLLALSCAGPGQPTATGSAATPVPRPSPTPVATVKLPEPRLASEVSLEETLVKRRSVREYADAPLTLPEVSQLLWSAQGLTSERGGRTAPSAGALYPLEVYLVVGNVQNLAPGVYRYVPERHELAKVKDGDIRRQLAEAALGQAWVEEAAVVIAIAAVYERTTRKYGDRGVRYVHLEAGHAAQNVCLQAVALDLGAVPVGAFYDDRVNKVLSMSEDEAPVYLIPVGRKA